MNRSRRLIRQTLTVARRDFVATVFTPTFLLFLLAPLIMIGFGAVSGLGAASVVGRTGSKLRMVAIAQPEAASALRAADTRLRGLFRDGEAPPPLEIQAPTEPTPERALTALLSGAGATTTAAMGGELDKPLILFSPPSERHARYLARLAAEAVAAQRLGAGSEPDRLSRATIREVRRDRPSLAGRNSSSFFAVFGVFFLTLLLAGQAVSTMAEERSNKVIEILAAAVPLESVFLGKLVGMFGVAILFIAFWGVLAGNTLALVPGDLGDRLADLRPAMGLPLFGLLFLIYFTTAFMLLGAVFLGIGAQAATPREIQMLSLPITIFQVGMFGLSATAVGVPDGWIAVLARVFPFSSPFAMAGDAAASAEIWPHVAAILWQLFWVALTVTVGARLFRRGVLQSAGPKLFGRKTSRY